MFVGALPMPVVNQLIQSVDCSSWSEIFVCCSGSFRIDRALKTRYPTTTVRGNDVSLLSCAVGALLTGTAFDIAFRGRLAFIEDLDLQGFEARIAAVIVALRMGQFSGDNAYAAGHFAHCREHFADYHAKALAKIATLAAGVHLDEFVPGDFRDHAKRATDAGHGIAGFLPTYKGGYERMYRFIDEGVEWSAPSFRTWDPADLPAWLGEVAATGAPYFIVTDHELQGFEASTEYRSKVNKPLFGYMGNGRASFRRARNRESRFAYTKVDAAKLGVTTDVQLVPGTSAQMTFLRNAYLAKGIAHASGVANYLVLLDGALAGGFIYSRDKYDPANCIYLLSDFCITHERRLAKLVAMLACSRESVQAWCKRFVVRPHAMRTTAFTDAPVSMKYRKIYELTSRKPGQLAYEAPISQARPAAAIYLDWLARFGQAADPDRPVQARRAAHPQEKRALHGRAGIQSPGGEFAP